MDQLSPIRQVRPWYGLSASRPWRTADQIAGRFCTCGGDPRSQAVGAQSVLAAWAASGYQAHGGGHQRSANRFTDHLVFGWSNTGRAAKRPFLSRPRHTTSRSGDASHTHCSPPSELRLAHWCATWHCSLSCRKSGLWCSRNSRPFAGPGRWWTWH